jgi:hypothetical protein
MFGGGLNVRRARGKAKRPDCPAKVDYYICEQTVAFARLEICPDTAGTGARARLKSGARLAPAQFVSYIGKVMV